MAWRLGVDVGGTFTDLALVNVENGRLLAGKVLSTPENPSVGVLEGARIVLSDAGIEFRDLSEILHATTIAANTIIQGNGARVGFVTTRGFRDIVYVGHQVRHNTYNLIDIGKHAPLVERENIYELNERMNSAGGTVLAPDASQTKSLAQEMQTDGIEAIAIGFINSYVNPAHEDLVQRTLMEFDKSLDVTTSTSVSRQVSEFERFSTAVANAYVRPRFATYVSDLKTELTRLGFQGDLYMMQSNGGLATPEQLVATPLSAVEASPAGGVVAGLAFAAATGTDNVMTLDMGGTTAKACLITAGEVPVTRSIEVDQAELTPQTGVPLQVPSIDVLEIGAGGGSIAQSKLGMVQTGPESAGSEPGPACYGRGGTDPTVTDGNLVLGYLDPENFAGGKIRLDTAAANAAIVDEVGEPLGLTPEAAAWAIHEAVTVDMDHALRAVSVERGRDPRRYTLVAMGGAAPTHASRLARRLGISRVVVPPSAGVIASFGLLGSQAKFDVSQSLAASLDDGGMVTLRSSIDDLRERGKALLGQAVDAEGLQFEVLVEMRYAGQGHLIEVPLQGGAMDSKGLRRRFLERYRELYGFAAEDGGVEIGGVRATISGAEGAPLVDVFGSTSSLTAISQRQSLVGERAVYFPELGGYEACGVWDRQALTEGDRLDGPGIIQDAGCTIVVLPGDAATVDSHGNVLLDVTP